MSAKNNLSNVVEWFSQPNKYTKEFVKNSIDEIKNTYSDVNDMVQEFNELVNNNEKMCKKLRKYIGNKYSEDEIIKTIENDVYKRLAHLSNEEQKKQAELEVNKYKLDKEKKRKRNKQKNSNKEKTDDELVNALVVNLEKQLSHKLPEERQKRIDEEVKKYKEILNKRNKSIDELVNDEKADLEKQINEYIEKHHADKSDEEKKKLFEEHLVKNLKSYKENLEDAKIFNKRIEEKRKEFEEIKYNNNFEGMDKMRSKLIEISIRQKREFLGLQDENSNDFEIKKNNMRTFEPGKGPILSCSPS